MAIPCTSCRASPSAGLEPREQLRVHPRLHGPAVEPEAAGGLLITAGLGVDQRAVAAEDLLGRQPGGEDLLRQSPARIAGRDPGGGEVLAADEDVAHALSELADVARPRIV